MLSLRYRSAAHPNSSYTNEILGVIVTPMFKAVPNLGRSRTQSDSFPAVLLQSPPRGLMPLSGLIKELRRKRTSYRGTLLESMQHSRPSRAHTPNRQINGGRCSSE